jgi:aryl-alcohol dehydrogenase-like predicted oxidoreductase
MDRALDEGINFFDTANVYGWKKGEGVTEQHPRPLVRQGRRAPRQGGAGDQGVRVDGRVAQREQAVGAEHPPGLRGLAARMQTDHIDLYQMHHVDRDTPWDEIWQAMDLLVQQGKVLYVGSSNFAGWHIVKANEAARRRQLARPGERAVALQPGRAHRSSWRCCRPAGTTGSG